MPPPLMLGKFIKDTKLGKIGRGETNCSSKTYNKNTMPPRTERLPQINGVRNNWNINTP